MSFMFLQFPIHVPACFLEKILAGGQWTFRAPNYVITYRGMDPLHFLYTVCWVLNFHKLWTSPQGCGEKVWLSRRTQLLLPLFPLSCTAKGVLMLLSQRICQVNRLLKHHRAFLWQLQCAKEIGCLLNALRSYWDEGSHQQKGEWTCYIEDTTSIAV